MSSLPVEFIYSTSRMAERLAVTRNQVVHAIKKHVITPTKINGRWALTNYHQRVLATHFTMRMVSKELASIPKIELLRDEFEGRRRVAV